MGDEQKIEAVISQHPFFKGLEEWYIEQLSRYATTVSFKADEYIFQEGSDAENFYLIQNGKVAVEIALPGKKPIPIQSLSEGEILGWSWFVEPHHWRFSARAEIFTELIALNGKYLRTKCEEDHELGYALLKRLFPVVTRRLGAARLKLLDIPEVGHFND